MTHRIEGADLAPLVLGASGLEPDRHDSWAVHRMPAWARAQVEDLLFHFAVRCPAGVRLRVRTAATRLVVELRTAELRQDGFERRRPRLVLAADGATHELAVVDLPLGDEIVVSPDASYEMLERPATRVEIPLPDGRDPMVPLEIFLPHDCAVSLVAIEADATIEAAPVVGLRWTHYGSSISHGAEAPTVAGTWPVRVALGQGWSLRDLGMAGQAQLDGFAARVVRDAPADLITLKIGINLINGDTMRRRAMLSALHGFLDTIREGQPEVPIVLVSAVSCPIHEATPGPSIGGAPGARFRASSRDVEFDDGVLTLADTRALLRTVVETRSVTDPALAYLEGTDLFGPDDVGLLYDGLHPDAEGLELIASRFPDALRRAVASQPAFAGVVAALGQPG